jgi:small conductance mechanosensitive channel
VDSLDQVFDPSSASFWNLLLAIVAIGMSIIVARYARRSIRRKFADFEDVDQYAGAMIGRVTGWSIVFLGVIFALSIMGVDMVPVALILVIGLAFLLLSGKSLIENWAAGLVLQARSPYRPGDRIETGEFAGDVELTNIRSVVLRQGDGQIVHVPNIDVLRNPLVNRTGDQAGRRSALNFGVAYGTKVDEVERILTEAATSVDGVRENPAPSAWISSLGDTTIVVELRFWTDFQDRRTIPSAVAEKALSRLNDSGVSMPFPTQQLMLSGDINRPSDALARWNSDEDA